MSDGSNIIGGGVKERLARIETKVDTLLGVNKDTEERLRSLEKRRWTEHGFVLALSLVANRITSKLFGP